jgi:hypothetical protein
MNEGLLVGIEGSASTEETSSSFGSGSTRRGSSGGVFSRMRSKSFSFHRSFVIESSSYV